MLKLKTALAASAATILVATAPALAGETLSIGRIMIADIGRDTVEMAKTKETTPKIDSMISVDYPELQRLLGSNSEAVIAIELNAQGKVTKSSIYKTSGNRVLDINALFAVSKARYRPGTIDGTPVGGAYAVNIEFNPEK